MLRVGGRIGIVVVNAEREKVEYRPWETQRLDANDRHDGCRAGNKIR